jgi:pilus assembly protein CpaE
MPDLLVFLVSREKNPVFILEGLRSGADDFFQYPDQEDSFVASVRRALRKGTSGQALGKVISFFSLKGGEGVTTFAVNSCDNLQRLTEDRTLLFDLNLYTNHVSNYLNFPCNYTPFDLMDDIDRIDDKLLFSALNQHKRGFYVLGVSKDVADADELSGEDIMRMLQLLRIYFDYVVLDLPHDFSGRTLAALEASNTVMLLVQQDVQSIRGAQRALDIFNKIGYDDRKVKLLVNRYIKRNDITEKDIEQVLEYTLHSVVGNDYRTVSDAISEGRTLFEDAAKSRINKEFTDLAMKLSPVRV